MNFSSFAVLAIGILVLGLIIALILHLFSPEARIERRRRRNNYPVASRGKRPMVKFSVRTKKDDR